MSVVLLQLGCRLAHVLRRILPISLYLLQKDGRCLAGHDLFLKRVGKAYSKFIEEVGSQAGLCCTVNSCLEYSSKQSLTVAAEAVNEPQSSLQQSSFTVWAAQES